MDTILIYNRTTSRLTEKQGDWREVKEQLKAKGFILDTSGKPEILVNDDFFVRKKG